GTLRLRRKFSFGPYSVMFFRRRVRWRRGGRIKFKGSHFEKEITLWGIRWYVAYPSSYRQLEEMMEEQGVAVDQATLNRWVLKYAPEFEKQFRGHQRLWDGAGDLTRPT